MVKERNTDQRKAYGNERKEVEQSQGEAKKGERDKGQAEETETNKTSCRYPSFGHWIFLGANEVAGRPQMFQKNT